MNATTTPVPAYGGGPVPFDLDEIEARADAAPGNASRGWPESGWAELIDALWIPWSAEDDRFDPEDPWATGRYISVDSGDWHGTGEVPQALWEFLARSRDDVLALAAEVRRLRSLVPPHLLGASDATARHCPFCQVGWVGLPSSRCWVDNRHPGNVGRVSDLNRNPFARSTGIPCASAA